MKSLYLLLVSVVVCSGQVPPFPPALPAIPTDTNVDTITLAWNKNSETNIVGYWLYTNLTKQVFTVNTNVTIPATGRRSYTVTATNSVGLESAQSSAVIYPGDIIVRLTPQWSTNILGPWNIVTNWPAFTLTNPAISPKYYRILTQ